MRCAQRRLRGKTGSHDIQTVGAAVTGAAKRVRLTELCLSHCGARSQITNVFGYEQSAARLILSV